MANIIKIKRSSVTTIPASLAEGELAYSEKAGVKKLYIGTNGGANIEVIGGKFYTDQLDAVAANSIKGNNTGASGPALDLTAAQVRTLLNVADGAEANTVDSVNSLTGAVVIGISELDDTTISGAAKGDILVHNGTDWVDLTIGSNDQVLTADSTQATGVKWATNSSGVTVFTNLTDTPASYAGAGSYFVKVNSGATALEFVADPGFLLDITAEPLGDLSNVDTTGQATGTVLRFNGTNWVPYADSNYAASSHTHTKSDITDFVESAYVHTTGDESIGGNKTFSNNVTVTGNLTVNGTTTAVNSNEVHIGDNIMVLNSDEAGTPSQDGGIEIERGTSQNAQLVWDESVDKWAVLDVTDGVTYDAISLEGHTHVAGDITSGTWGDSFITQSSVTQHEGAINHDALTNYVADRHIAHSSISINAGSGLTGGGSIAATRTIDVSWGGSGVATTVARSDHNHSGTYLESLASSSINDLSDTPANFSGAGGYLVKVNAGATAIEYTNTLDGGTF